MKDLRISTPVRVYTIAVLVFLVVCMIVLANEGGTYGWPPAGWGWYLVGAALLALAWLILSLPGTSTPAARPPASTDGKRTYAVAIAFRGSPPVVFDRLLGQGWKLGGHGPCDASPDHEGCVTLEVPAGGPEVARVEASKAVKKAGARIERIGQAMPVK